MICPNIVDNGGAEATGRIHRTTSVRTLLKVEQTYNPTLNLILNLQL
jgi:hypothetical protein